MIFTNFSFFLFFLIFLFVYSFFAPKGKSYVLLFGNMIFCLYAGWQSFIVAMIVVLFTYFMGNAKRLCCWIGILLNIAIIIFFKYFTESFYPLGISFYSFTCIAYLADLIKNTGNKAIKKNFLNFCNYILFFPKLVSGPVERASNLLPQFNENKTITFANLQLGFHIFLFGFFKKIVIANRLQIYVDKVFNNLSSFGGGALIIAVVFYSIQIYCDFSGYTDMAIGVAKIFGFNLTQNFKNPYSAKSIGEFWHRWHISLSSWLRDYIYIPLGGNRKGLPRKYLNIILTFLVSGIWHGSTILFCIWGLLHAIFQILEGVFINNLKLHKNVKHFITLFFVAFAWIFFRLKDLNDVQLFFSNLFNLSFYSLQNIKSIVSGVTFTTFNNMTPALLMNINVFISLILLFIFSKIECNNDKHISEVIIMQNKWKRYLFDYALIFLIFTTGVFDSTRFIYAAF